MISEGRLLTTEIDTKETPDNIVQREKGIVSVPEGVSEKDPEDAFAEGYLLAVEQYFAGPLPSPDILQEYENLFPGSSNIIFDEFKTDAAHQREMEKMRLVASINVTKRGLRDALLVCILGMVFGFSVIVLGVTLGDTAGKVIVAILSGSVLGGVSMVNLVGKFIDGPSRTKKEIKEKPESEEDK